MLLEFLKEIGIVEALEKLGYSAEEIFGALSEEAQKKYMTYTWKVVPCSVEGIQDAYVVHAVPSMELMEECPWEEWFVQFGNREHHVLFLAKNDACTEEIFIPADDVDHPSEIAGKDWFYYCDTQSFPYLK